MKKHIIRLLLIGTAATLFLASCKKNNGSDTVPEGRFRASIEQGSSGGNGSKTHLDPDWNAGSGAVKWDEHDLIKVRNAAGTTLTFQLDDGYENTSEGLFYTGEPHDDFFPSDDYAAIYPVENNSISGTTATFTLPATQTYVENSFAKGAMPMVAYSTNQTLQFKNVLGGLCFPMVGDGITLTRIVLTSNNAADKLWGVFTADCTSATPVPTYANGGSNSITLDCGSGIVLDATNATDFYVMVPPGTLEKGFTVEAYYNEYKVYEKSADWTASPVSGFIPRNTVRRVDTDLTVVVSDLTVTTISPTFISINSAYGGGTVALNSKVNAITERGLCWALASQTNMPTIADNHSAEGETTVGAFRLTFEGLTKDQVYYVRAYARNEIGDTFYGEPIPFATRKDYANDFDGKMPGLFTINDNGDQVQFSSGNLQYQASTNTWRFAEYQFEHVSGSNNGLVYENGMYPDASLNGAKSDNTLIANDYSGWIDLFGWGTSGINDYSPIAVCWQPWSTSSNSSDYRAYGSWTKNLYDESGKADWGYNAISNGGNMQKSGWRTLRCNSNGSSPEWLYLFNSRTCTYRYAPTRLYVRGLEWGYLGMIVFPDDFEWPIEYVGVLSLVNETIAGSDLKNALNEAQWSLLEHEGAVFLPAAAYRTATNLEPTEFYGHYWTATNLYASNNAYYLKLDFSFGKIENSNYRRHYGRSVRLVQDAN